MIDPPVADLVRIRCLTPTCDGRTLAIILASVTFCTVVIECPVCERKRRWNAKRQRETVHHCRIGRQYIVLEKYEAVS